MTPLLPYLILNLLFLLGGILLLTISLITHTRINDARTLTLTNAPETLLMETTFPRTAAMANAGLVFVGFLVSIPGVLRGLKNSKNGNENNDQGRVWLKVHGYVVVGCAVFTLVLGLNVWFETLKTRANLSAVWAAQTAEVQSLLQRRFDCCGYLNSTFPPFQLDSTCTSPLVAAQKQGCVAPFSTFANVFLDIIFTADFGLVAIDTILLLCTAVVLKDRKERERYRLIDAKHGLHGI